MRLIKGTINVFVDTQVFDSQQYDFSRTVFQQLIQLKEANAIKIFSTEITRREMERHLARKAEEVFHAIGKFQKTIRPLSFPIPEQSVNQIQEELLAQFRDYWQKLAVVELPFPSGTLERVIDQYFSASPPFGTGDKKAEFPDAIAADSILAWCAKNDELMHIVTADNDWKAVWEKNQRTLRLSERLQQLLTLFPDPKLAVEIAEVIRGYERQIIDQVSMELLGTIDEASEELHFEFLTMENSRLGDIFILDADEDGCVTAQADVLFDFKGVVRKKHAYTLREYAPGRQVVDWDDPPFPKRGCRGRSKSTVELYAQYQRMPDDMEFDWNDIVIVSSHVAPATFVFSADDTQLP